MRSKDVGREHRRFRQVSLPVRQREDRRDLPGGIFPAKTEPGVIPHQQSRSGWGPDSKTRKNQNRRRMHLRQSAERPASADVEATHPARGQDPKSSERRLNDAATRAYFPNRLMKF